MRISLVRIPDSLAASSLEPAAKNLRPRYVFVKTTDAMTATIEEIPYDLLHKITERITHEVPGVNRVLMDLTPKPTGTIEWE